MANPKVALLDDYKRKVLKALDHFQHSLNKVQSMPVKSLTEDQLETWESFVARFARVVDLYLTKYLKARVLMDDPAFDGSLRDFCNVGEKMQLLDSAESWIILRELRNTAAHEYEEDDLAGFFDRLRLESKRLLLIRGKL